MSGCRIFYEEIDRIVEGSRRGIPEFYIVLDENENRESFFLLDEEEQDRTIFLVRSFGFNHQRFTEFYRKLRWNVPGKPESLERRTRRYGTFENQISKSALWQE